MPEADIGEQGTGDAVMYVRIIKGRKYTLFVNMSQIAGYLYYSQSHLQRSPRHENKVAFPIPRLRPRTQYTI